MAPPSTTCRSPGSSPIRCSRTGCARKARSQRATKTYKFCLWLRALVALLRSPKAPWESQLLFLTPRRHDAEALHLAIEVAPFDAQRVGGPRDVAVLRGQGAEDVVAFEALPRLVQCR